MGLANYINWLAFCVSYMASIAFGNAGSRKSVQADLSLERLSPQLTQQRLWSTIVLVLFLLLLPGCAQEKAAQDLGDMGEPAAMPTSDSLEVIQVLKIACPSFADGQEIPAIYTCQGADINPRLDISGIPSGAKSLVLIVDDPDAPRGTWVHWVVWNIRPQGRIDESSVPHGAMQGLNDFGEHDYRGPCPPSGVHRYFLRLYALDTMLGISEDSRRTDVDAAMQGHILATAELIGTYRKK